MSIEELALVVSNTQEINAADPHPLDAAMTKEGMKGRTRGPVVAGMTTDG